MRANKNFWYILLVFTLLHYLVAIGQKTPTKLSTTKFSIYQNAQRLFEQGNYHDSEKELKSLDKILNEQELKVINPFKEKLALCIKIEKKINSSDSTALKELYDENPNDPKAQEYVKRQEDKNIYIIVSKNNDKKESQLIEQKFFYDDSIKKLESGRQSVVDKSHTDSVNTSIAIETANSEKEELKKENQQLSQKNKKILKAFYWYNDSIALAVKPGENQKIIYYFINKEGKELNNLKEWDNAEPFNATFVGYAKVKKKNKGKEDTEYLIDTSGNREEYGKYNNGVTALDLSDNNYYTSPSNPFQQDPLEIIFSRDKYDNTRKIKILNLRNTQISGFYPDNDTEFLSLEYLDLSNNNLSLSSSFEGLKYLPSLKYLILRNSRINKMTAGFTKLKNLTYLDISKNKIDKINLRYIIEKLVENKIENLTLLVDSKQEKDIESINDKMEKANWNIVIAPEKN